MGEEFGWYSLRFGAMGRAQENPVPRVGKNDSNLVADRTSFPGCVRFSIGNAWRMNNDRPHMAMNTEGEALAGLPFP
jgi:hypothetical protein